MDWLRKGFGSKSKNSTYDGTNTKDASISRMGDSGEGYDDDKTASPTSTFVSDLPAYKETDPTAEGSPFFEQFNRLKLPASSTPAVDELFDMLRPPTPSSVFTGRVQELEDIDAFFRQTHHDGELTLRGVSGSGKTQLALKFAQVTTFHSDIFYVGAGPAKHELLELLDQWNLLQVKAAVDPMVQQGYPHSEISSASSATLTGSPSRIGLVIFDDLDVPWFQHAYAFKRYMLKVFGFEKVSVLYLLDMNAFRKHDIDQKTYYIPRSLEVEDAVQALAKSAQLQHEDLHAEAEETARDIVKHFDYYPVAIVQVGGAIRDSGLTLQEYWGMSAEDHQEQIKTISASLDYLWRLRHKKLSEASRTLLRLFVLFPVDDQPFFVNILTRARANLANYQPLTLTEANVEQIKDDDEQLLSLFTPDVKESLIYSPAFKTSLSELNGWFIPPLGDHGQGLYLCAHGWAKDVISNSEFAGVSAAYLLAASIGSATEYGPECRTFRSKLDELTRSLLRWYPDGCAHHRLRFSLVDEACGRWSEAIDMKKLAIEKYERELGLHHPETMFATVCLAKTYCQLGRWRDAKKVQSNLLSLQEEELGEVHPDTLSTMYDLASTLSRMGRWEDVESLLERVCSSRKQTLGETHPGTLSAMYSLASNYSEQGRWQEALELHENVLETRRRTLGEGHADTLSSMHSLATKHWESGQSAKNVEESNIRVLEARKKALGLEHPDTFSSLLALSAAYRRQGQWRLATDITAEVLDMQKKVLGRDHIDTIQNMQNLASWYSEHGGLSDAANLHAEILESRRAVYGNSSPETLTSMGELVSLYWRRGLWAQAEGLHVELLRERKNTLGDDHPTYLATSLDLATHYLGQCRWREASLLLKKVLSIKRQDVEAEEDDREITDLQQQLDLTLFALSLDVFIISPAMPMESVVTHFTRRAGLKDYSFQLRAVPDLPSVPIARGGFSNIYRVTLRDGSELAVKCLKGAHGQFKQVKQTIRELSTWSQLQHNSIATLLGLALFRDQLAMVSSWNKRGNVMQYMAEKPDLDRYGLCTQLVNVVVYLHESDVIHGDLKGANILVSDDGTLQLTDFGLTIMHDATIQFSKSEDRVGGTLRWMAPELVFSAGDVGLEGRASQSLSETLTEVKESTKGAEAAKLCKETDIYALGMTMLELLTSKQPFREIENDAAVILALGQGKRPRRPKKTLDQSHRGAPFWEILQRCWAQVPADRPTANQIEALMLQLGPN